MQNMNNKTEKRNKQVSRKILAWIMLVAMLVEMFAFSCSAIVGGAFDFSGFGSDGNKVTDGITNFDSEEVIAQLKKDFLKSVNENVVRRIDEYKLTGDMETVEITVDVANCERLTFWLDHNRNSYSYGIFDATLTK